MTQNHIDIVLLSDYLNGIVNKETAAGIEMHLAGCERCLHMSEGIKVFMDENAGSGADEYKEFLHQTEEKVWNRVSNKFTPVEKQNSSNFRTQKYMLWLSAALILIVASTSLFVYVTTKSGKNVDAVISAHLEVPYVAPPVFRSSEEINKVWLEAITFYENGNFEETEKRLQQVLDHEEANTTAQFYYGLSLLYQPEKTEAAITHLTSFLEQESRYKEQARWYLSMAYFLADDETRGTQFLEIIASNNQHFNNKEARALLDNLSTIKIR